MQGQVSKEIQKRVCHPNGRVLQPSSEQTQLRVCEWLVTSIETWLIYLKINLIFKIGLTNETRKREKVLSSNRVQDEKNDHIPMEQLKILKLESTAKNGLHLKSFSSIF